MDRTRRCLDYQKMLSLLTVLMGFFLNQSILLFRINVSISDVFLLLIILLLFIKGDLVVSPRPLKYFLLVSGVVLFTAQWIVPRFFPYDPSPWLTLRGYAILAVGYLYFLVGSSLGEKGGMLTLIRSFSYGALVAGVLSILMVLIKNIPKDFMYAGGFRFKGFMIDPNYFSVLQILSIAYFTRDTTLSHRWRGVAIGILVISILATGSKTGMMTLLIFLAYLLFESVFQEGLSLKRMVKNYWSKGLPLVWLLIFMVLGIDRIGGLSEIFPALSRIKILFMDFGGAVTADGSTRLDAWGTALRLIVISPLFGVGVGHYRQLGELMWGYGNVAHNTYLQWMTDWGLPLALVWMLFVLNLFLVLTTDKRYQSHDFRVLKDFLVVIMVGSLALSLNNMRLLWLVLGALAVMTDVLETFRFRKIVALIRSNLRISLMVALVLSLGVLFWHSHFQESLGMVRQGTATYEITLSGVDEPLISKELLLEVDTSGLVERSRDKPERALDPVIFETISAVYSEGEIRLSFNFQREEQVDKTLKIYMRFLSEISQYQQYIDTFELKEVEKKAESFTWLNWIVVYGMVIGAATVGSLMVITRLKKSTRT